MTSIVPMARHLPPAVSDASAWRAADLRRDRSWEVRLSVSHSGILRDSLAAVRSRGLRAADFERSDFPLKGMEAFFRSVLEELESGKGVVLLRGLPLGDDEEDAARLLWGIGLHLGRALRQHERVNVGGFRDDLLAHIVDQGLDYNAPNVHGSATSAEQMPHTDPADVVGLLCVRPAASGGTSRIASAMSVYNVLRERRPDLAAVLLEGYAHDLRNQQARDSAVTDSAVTPRRIPVFSEHAGKLSCIFNSKTVLAAERKTGVALGAAQREALDAMVALSLDAELRLDMELEPGDLQLLNNYTILHSRTAWTDPDPARRRVMLRLWLKVPNARTLAPGIAGGYVTGAHYDVAEQAS
jgi:alpha-ketoglutarate-dependent taurine dioxygenase